MKGDMKVVLSRTASHRVDDKWLTFQAGREYPLDATIEKMVKLGKTEILREIPMEPASKTEAAPKPKSKRRKRKK